MKCGECPHQAFIPVTDDIVAKHLRGANGPRAFDGDFVAGVYPLFTDDTCWFPRHGPLFNLRSEGRHFANSNRCLVIASGFFEFTGASYPKTKQRFTLDDAPCMAIAGIWRAGGGNQPDALAMLTTAPGPDVVPNAKAGEDVYAVLREVIAKTGTIALTRVVISQRERTVARRHASSGSTAHRLLEERDLNSAYNILMKLQNCRLSPRWSTWPRSSSNARPAI